MMVKDRSGNAFDTIRIRGKWWIPDGTENPRKVSGELTFEVSTGGTLELDEALSDKLREIPVVHGQGTKGECVTVFNGFSDGLQMNANSMGVFRLERIRFYDMWVGNQRFDSKEEVRFVSYSFGMHNIENWADRHCFPMPKSQKTKPKNLSIVYKPPKPLLLFEDERMIIRLDAVWTGPSYSVGQLESSIQHYPRIVIRSKDGALPYYGDEESISDHEWMIFVLIALLMGVITWKFGFEGVVEPLQITDRGVSEEISVRHYFQHDWGKTNLSHHPTKFELLFPYEMLGRRFPRIAARFSELRRINDSPVDILYRMQCMNHAFYPSTLPELLFAFEKLEENLLAGENKRLTRADRTFSKRLRNKLEPVCTEKEWHWLEPKMDVQGPSFSTRCRVAFQKMSKIYPDLKTDLQKPLTKYFRRTRNLYAHEVKSTIDDPALYIYTSHWMAEFMTLMILRACGLSTNKIKQVFFRDPGPDHGKTKRFFDYLRSEIAAGRLK